MCICSLRYPPYNADAPYYHAWRAWLYNIFFTLSHDGKILEKIIEHKMWVLIFSTTFVRNISHFKWRKLHNEELNDLYSSTNIFQVII